MEVVYIRNFFYVAETDLNEPAPFHKTGLMH
jgi:hypothetical protein